MNMIQLLLSGGSTQPLGCIAQNLRARGLGGLGCRAVGFQRVTVRRSKGLRL